MRVLLFEDAEIPSRFNESLAAQGFDVERCLSALQALRRALEMQPDLILVNGAPHDMELVTLCRSLRTAGVSVAMMVVTEAMETAQRIAILDAGADDHLQRPVDFEELVARARAVLRRCGVMSEKIHVGSLVIDPRSRYVQVNGQDVEMTDREASLLVFLATRVGAVVTREDIIKHVWKSVVPASNTIDVNIRHLRDKLGDAAQYLKTVRGRGYILQD